MAGRSAPADTPGATVLTPRNRKARSPCPSGSSRSRPLRRAPSCCRLHRRRSPAHRRQPGHRRRPDPRLGARDARRRHRRAGCDQRAFRGQRLDAVLLPGHRSRLLQCGLLRDPRRRDGVQRRLGCPVRPDHPARRSGSGSVADPWIVTSAYSAARSPSSSASARWTAATTCGCRSPSRTVREPAAALGLLERRPLRVGLGPGQGRVRGRAAAAGRRRRAGQALGRRRHQGPADRDHAVVALLRGRLGDGRQADLDGSVHVRRHHRPGAARQRLRRRMGRLRGDGHRARRIGDVRDRARHGLARRQSGARGRARHHVRAG